MIKVDNSLCPNKEEVSAKIMDGEAIIINLSTGVYYSMDNVGAVIWEMIEGGFNLVECVAAILERYDVSRKEALADVKRLVEELVEENLIYMSDQEAPPQNNRKLIQQQKLPYESPKLNIYRDMGDLLALDPPTPGLKEISWRESNDEDLDE
jgi:coenzyme PQQ synthesis protein D (PqqD)